MDTLEHPEETRSPRSGFGLGLLVGAVVGAAVGAAVALLFAPGPGRETRRQLRRRLAAVSERVGEEFDDLDGRVRREIRRHRS